ncbi:MAG: hypothetical protein HQ552_08465 [Desulfobacteraceae bacterium]|nr:hypothetical protein [Desulfobacteraceae bacterium]
MGSIKKTENIKSMEEFIKRFYPKSLKKDTFDIEDDPQIIGSVLAEKSLKKVKYQISRK